MKREAAERLHEAWRDRDAVSVGREIFEPLDRLERAARAAAVLQVAVERVAAPPEVSAVLDLARDRSRWREAHAAFYAIRRLTLAHEREPEADRARGALLYLAENVAKTVYNASGEPAPFDEDAPWWIASCARSLVRALADEGFEARIWAVLVERAG